MRGARAGASRPVRDAFHRSDRGWRGTPCRDRRRARCRSSAPRSLPLWSCFTPEELAELALRVEETCAHRTFGRTDDDSDLGARAFLDLGEDDDDALLERKRVEREHEPIGELDAGSVAFGIWARGLGLARQLCQRRT